MNLGVNYFDNKGKYFSKYFINENVSLIHYFFLPENNSNLSASLYLSKYISFLESKMSISTNYTIYQYNNIINNSVLRDNIGEILNANFGFSTAFSIPFNFSNEFSYSRMLSKNTESEAYTINSLENLFEISIKFSKYSFVTITTDYVLPNIKNKQNAYLFLDLLFDLLTKNKKWEYTVSANNLLNKNNFEQIQTSDYSIYSSKTSILQRHFMLSISYNF